MTTADIVKGLLPDYTWREAQKMMIEATLEKFDGNRTYTAKALGLSIRTIRIKIRNFDITIPSNWKRKRKA